MKRAKLLFLLACLSLPLAAQAQNATSRPPDEPALMPMPASVSFDAGGLPLDPTFAIATTACKDGRVRAAADRLVDRITLQTGLPILHEGSKTALSVSCQKPAGRVPKAVEDESYTLKVGAGGATLSAATPYGALHGLATFAQLIEQGPSGFVVRAATIQDRPRFTWRGLMIDSGRHWMPLEVIKRNIDGMAAVKLNVLHWHLSEDQGFRVESRRYPKLQQRGSDGHYYTQAEVRDIVRYAADRGIRVVPEFDMPGHTGAWLVGYPQLAAGPGPYQIQREWGIFDPVLDPTNERVYVFLDRLLAEMTALFPDAYFHIGGDEVNGRQWKANPKIQAFMKRRGFKTGDDLQAYFNRRVSAMLTRHGKKIVGWDEVLHPDLPRNIVVQSWRGQKSLAEAAQKGYQGILSNGYYLDYMWSAERHYLVDPIGKEAADLPADAQARVLGGEACMWSEWVTPETIDSRIWPRTAAIAERYWSPAAVRNVPDMYRRLEVVSRELDFVGLQHRSNYLPMLERMTGGRRADALKGIVDLVEPVREYNRGKGLSQTSMTPLIRVIDAARPESEAARDFRLAVDAFLADRASGASRDAIEAGLRQWQQDVVCAAPLLDTPVLQEVVPLVKRVGELSALGLRALQAMQQGSRLELNAADTALLTEALKPSAEVHLMVADPIKRLVEAAAAAK